MRTLKLINWELALPLIDKMSILRVYTTVVALSTHDYKFYSTEENRVKVAWRWQMSPNTVKYALSQLVKKGFLQSESRGVYSVDKRFINEEENQGISASA